MNASIDAVRVAGTPEGPVPVVVMTAEGADGVLPIFIGFEEANSIAHGLDAYDIGRPLTHDLLLDVMEELGGRIDRVEITEISEEGTYIADIHIEGPRSSVVVDARPSDSLALAARTNAPIEIAESVFERGRQAGEQFDDLADIREIGELVEEEP
ncbi:bifunctional nuclease family protein [Halalkalicoccus ordinarius]|uniref:bifunctional nuclease family protein n=1 Tax=Halalkalicoccus ordinarius TaxID=3116651 RepID=UPI00300F00E1